MCEPPPHCIRWHEVDERLLPVDLDDRVQLPVSSLEHGVADDEELDEHESEHVPKGGDSLARTLAEVAPLRTVEPDLDYGYRPRVVVASATRFTASP